MTTDLATSKIVAAYCQKTPGSARLAKRAQGVFPSGITHDVRHVEPHGIYVTHASGSRKWDVDGNEYVDYSGGHGALLLGQAHPEVVAAVNERLPLGTHHGASHELEIRWGELIQDMIPSAERVRLNNSGTEATMLAMRLARAYSGKTKILRFLGHFHGWQDHVAFGVGSHQDGTPTPGVLPAIAEGVRLAPPWDIDTTRKILESYDDIAAVIIEPTGSSWGQVPVTKEFLRSLREITSKLGVVLIFDEVICGFRCSPGGAQGAWGITPDMTTLGKIVAGGLHGAATVGRKEILDHLDFTQASEENFEKVGHQGTYNGIPTTCAAGVTALEIVKSTDVCQQAINYGHKLQEDLNSLFRAEGVNWISYGTFGGFHVFVNPDNLDTAPKEIEAAKFDYGALRARVDPKFVMKLRVGLLLHGVDIQPWPGGMASATHTDADNERTVEAFHQTIRMLKEEGDLP